MSDSDDQEIGATNFSECGFEDMLLDENRNSKYRKAIIKAVRHRLKVDGKAHVLDIGSGTGLLSMYASAAGATSVTAVELDPVISKVSKEIAEMNGFGRLIKFINKESLEIDKLPQRANILVSEIFDSELLGENVLRTFRHALEHLTTPGVICIPARADVYIVPIESQILAQHCRLPEYTKVKCQGVSRGIDSHWLTSKKEKVDFASEPQLLKSFVFNNMESIALHGTTDLCFQISEYRDRSTQTGTTLRRLDGLLLWWDLDLTGDDTEIITTGTVKDDPRWRNHWLPVAYGFPQQLVIKPLECLHITGSHDDVSFWFNVKDRNGDGKELFGDKCTCQWHSAISPGTILRWNTNYIESSFVDLVIKESSDKTVVLLGSHSLLPTLLRVKRLIICDEGQDRRFCDLISQYCQSEIEFVNSLHGFKEWDTVDLIVFDVHSDESSRCIDFALPHLLATRWNKERTIKIIPEQLELNAIPLKFEDLWRRTIPIKQIEEFDYSAFNRCFGREFKVQLENLELLPLWEEVCYAKDNETTILSPNASDRCIPTTRELTIPVGADAFVFYYTAKHNGKTIYNAFERQGEHRIEWYKGCRQWIHLLEDEGSNKLRILFDDDNGFDYIPNFIIQDLHVPTG